MPFASVNGRSLHHLDTGGEGPVVVFSHGNLMDADMWAPQLAGLSPDFRCVAWDAPLHGRSEDATIDYWEAARDLLGLLDQLGVARATLVGHSQGGFVSLRAALLDPERVESLVLIDTMATGFPPEALAQMGAVRDGFAAAGPDAVAPILLPMLLGREDLHAEWRTKWNSQPRQRLADAVAMLMRADDISDRVDQIAVPTLIIHGENDQPVPLEAGRALHAALPDAELAVVPGAGHTPSLTHPDQVTDIVRGFLLNQRTCSNS